MGGMIAQRMAAGRARARQEPDADDDLERRAPPARADAQGAQRADLAAAVADASKGIVEHYVRALRADRQPGATRSSAGVPARALHGARCGARTGRRERRARWSRSPPTATARRCSARSASPTQIIHGVADPLVPVAAGHDLQRQDRRRARSTSSTAWATTCRRRSGRASSPASRPRPGARERGPRCGSAVGRSDRTSGAPNMSPNRDGRAQLNLSPTSWRLCVAPMMDWTDRHCRFFHRLLTRRARLYTEMVTTGALLHGDVARHLDFDPVEQPVALQLGGSEPDDLARVRAARRALGLRRDQPQLRLPERARPARRLRRLPDGRAGARRRLRPRDARRGRDPGHGQAPDRHRPDRELRLRARLRRHRRRRRLRGLHRPCAQRLAAGPQPEGEPRDAAAAPRGRRRAQARLPGARVRAQRRRRSGRRRSRRTSAPSTA